MWDVYVLSLIAAIVVFAIAALWAVAGVAGLLGRLPGNRWVGVRTAETRRSEEAWNLAQRIAAPGFLGGAVACAFGGLAAFTSRWGFLYALAGFVVGLLALSVLSGVAVRAAQAVAPSAEQGAGCTGGCCSGGDAATAEDRAGGTGESTGPGDATGSGDAHAAAADCGESSCGSCKLSGMCLPGDAAATDSAVPDSAVPDSATSPAGGGTGR
ncbi:hypothetical protein C6V83_01360 [Gordonia iterans]|uniref:SdpI family protein n=1 Tax=Gordonia iterans TaxID=1004901 RepID=A0A2S0KBS6_9ACTN|nr:SdpI family protein [Gordonia iterans]AVL99142.1 hypothetical protein C6V83_01360 [Gordonia iterans]